MTAAQRRWAAAAAAAGEAETVPRCYGIFPAPLIGVVGMVATDCWVALAVLLLPRSP